MKENAKGLIAYLFGWVGGLIVLFAFKDNTKLTKFHACQAITLSIVSCICSFALGFIPVVKYFGYLLTVAIFIAQILGMIKSYHEEEFEIPVVSDLTRNIFKKQLADDENM